jgi:hypothetical protein
MNFDRCTGIFILDTVINYSDSTVGFGTMFSPDSRYLYFSTTQHIYQVDTDAPNIGATFQTVLPLMMCFLRLLHPSILIFI